MPKYDEIILKSEDILLLLSKLKNIGWKYVRESSMNRILYLSAVLYSFRYPNEENIFKEDYKFIRTLSGPEDADIDNAITFLKTNELLLHSEEGYFISDVSHTVSLLDNYNSKEHWFDDVSYIIGMYGEDKIFDFIFRDPEYKNSLESNSLYSLNIDTDNNTVKFLNSFKEAFESKITTKDAILDNKDYLKLYFEFIFGKILRGEK